MFSPTTRQGPLWTIAKTSRDQNNANITITGDDLSAVCSYILGSVGAQHRIAAYPLGKGLKLVRLDPL